MMHAAKWDSRDVREVEVDGLFGSDWGKGYCGEVGGWCVGVGMVDMVVRRMSFARENMRHASDRFVGEISAHISMTRGRLGDGLRAGSVPHPLGLAEAA
jgi:hypothetical protein